MPAHLRTAPRPDENGFRHVTINLPRPMFDELVDFAESEGRNLSLQIRWMLQESIKRRNGGKAR